MSAFNLTRDKSKPSTASILGGLKFSTATKPTKQTAEQRRPSDVVLEFLSDQIELAKADIAGTKFVVPRTRFIKESDGSTKKVSKAVEPRRSFWQSGADWLLSVRYGNISVELSPGQPSIVAGAKLDDVIKTFELIKKAVEVGECDGQIAAAAEKAKRHKEPKAA